ncbi:MAG: glycosyltransferase family 2 protein [Lachnospiraceae bacterium]
MISIIIPIYNCEKLLPRCLESILIQDYIDYEVLLVNDGSIDGSAMVCKEYVAKSSGKFRYFEKQNGGVSSARNIGLDNAEGEYICFIDADDYVCQNYLKCLYVSAFESGADLVMCTIFSNTECGNKQTFNGQDEIVRAVLAIKKNQGPWCKLFKRELIGELRFSENVYMGEDTLFCVEYAKRCKTALYKPDRLYYYETPTSSVRYRTNKKAFKRYLTLIDSRFLMLTNIVGLNSNTIELLQQELILAIKSCAMFATILNDLYSINYVAKRAKELLVDINYSDSEIILLVLSPILYYLRKKFSQKKDALIYKLRHIK